MNVPSLLELWLGHNLAVRKGPTNLIRIGKTQQRELHHTFHLAELRKGDSPGMQE